MCRRKTHEEFMTQALAKHGERYDYSKTVYVNALTYITITCREHGDFQIKPNNHLKGDGCPICRYRKAKKRLYGFGINDLDDITTKDAAYQHWRGMIKRCYDEDSLKKSPCYRGCSVCEQWRYLSNFKKWFNEHYVEGWAIDKDILIKGNRVYSPTTCCFVPYAINSMFASLKKRSENLPLGVHYSKRLRKYRVDISKEKEKIYLGLFTNIEMAFAVYKEAKEKHIKELADRYKDRLSPHVYEVMCNYKVEMTD